MELDHDIPINVIMLQNFESTRYQYLDEYIDILKSCRKRDEFESLIRMIIDDTRLTTMKEILTKRISQDAKVLEETLNQR